VRLSAGKSQRHSTPWYAAAHFRGPRSLFAATLVYPIGAAVPSRSDRYWAGPGFPLYYETSDLVMLVAIDKLRGTFAEWSPRIATDDFMELRRLRGNCGMSCRSRYARQVLVPHTTQCAQTHYLIRPAV